MTPLPGHLGEWALDEIVQAFRDLRNRWVVAPCALVGLESVPLRVLQVCNWVLYCPLRLEVCSSMHLLAANWHAYVGEQSFRVAKKILQAEKRSSLGFLCVWSETRDSTLGNARRFAGLQDR